MFSNYQQILAVNWLTLIPNPIYVRVHKVLNPRQQSEDGIFTNKIASGVLTKDYNLISSVSLPEGDTGRGKLTFYKDFKGILRRAIMRNL